MDCNLVNFIDFFKQFDLIVESYLIEVEDADKVNKKYQ